MPENHPGEALSTHRGRFESAEREIRRASAVLARLETRADRATRGVDDPGTGSAVEAFERWLGGADSPDIPGDETWRLPDEDRLTALSYLTDPLLEGNTVFESSLEPPEADVRSLAADLETHVETGDVDPETLVTAFRNLVESGDGETLAALVSLFQLVVRAARRHRDEIRRTINGADADPGGTSAPQSNPYVEGEPIPGAGGALGDFFAAREDELSILDDEPIALLPVRLETRFVTPNPDPESEPALEAGTDWNRTDPDEEELRIRVYPDQIHVDSHEPELTADEERWGRNFWAQVWVACHRTETVDGETVLGIDETMLPSDLTEVAAGLTENWAERFSADDADRHAEIKERAWGQLVDRFGTERAAWVVHAMAPDRGTAMLTGWAGGEPPWSTDEGPPELTLPDPDVRPESWSRQPRARLLPDRWLAVGTWRPADDPDADPTTVRVTGDPIQEPLPVGPNPETVAGEDVEERAGTAPEGMEWMVDWAAARDVGMGLTVTAEDLDGTDPGSVVFDELLVVGVKASLSGSESTDALESTFATHHYTDGLELLRRGTPTNNHDLDSGYVKNPRPEETVDVECGGPLTSFGDFSDGDLLARALGISDPGESHVFAHVDGADERSQAAARHMNSVLWPGTIGYYFRNVLVSNDWTAKSSLWEDEEVDDQSDPFPSDPMSALGDRLKSLDAWRRHFVRYVRAGGPFPPIRIGRQPYGILPVETLPSGDTDLSFDPIPVEEFEEIGGGTIVTPTGEIPVAERDRTTVPLDPTADELQTDVDETTESDEPSETEEQAPPDEPAETADSARTERGTPTVGDDAVRIDAETVGRMSTSGYSVSVTERAGQTDADLYGSSFDPVVPRTTDSDGDGSPESDGGDPATYVRHRALRIDDEAPTEIATWLRKFTDSWDAGTGEVDRVDDGNDDVEKVERILGREAAADDYVREHLWGAEEYQRNTGSPYVSGGALENHKRGLRSMLESADMDDLDPRLAYILESRVGSRSGPTGGGRHSDRPIATVASDRAPHYLTILYDREFEFVQEMGFPTPLSKFNVDRDFLKDVLGYGEGIEEVTDEQLALDVILRTPDRGPEGLIGLILASFGEEYLDFHGDGRDTPYGRKVDALNETGGDALQHTLFKQLTRFSTIEAYLSARIRLALKWDEPGLLSDVDQLLSRDGPVQQPVPDPTFHDDSTRTVWEALGDDPPAYDDYDTYADLLRKTCSPEFDEPAVDPRMREFFESLAALEAQDPADLRRLLTETMDLASHRLDAWWTSLATRRLFERRESQEVDLYDGAEYAFVGDHFRRGEGTERPELVGEILDPEPVVYEPYETTEDSSADETDDATDTADSTATGSAGTGLTGDVPEYQATDAATGGPVLRGETERGFVENAQSRATVTGVTATATDRSGDESEAAESEGSESDSAGEPVTYVGAYAFVENLHSDRLDDELPGIDSASGGAEAEYVHAPSPQHATTAAILRSGRKNHDDDPELRELLDIDLSPGRVRAAKNVLAGIRQGQLLGDILGYRFERRLRERTKRYNETSADTINLVKYKFPLREAYPAVEGQLDHGEGESDEDEDDAAAGVGTESAKSDVVDGYRLLTNWQETEDAAFLANVDYEPPAGSEDDPSTLDEALSGPARTEFLAILGELDAIVDSVTDLLLSESVHQLGKGNFERAGGSVDDLVKGKQVAEPEVTQTPRTDVGVTHRLGIVFGDPETLTTPAPWDERTPVVEPDALPPTDGSSRLRSHQVDADLHLQARADGERTIDSWLGSVLPDPARVSCGASIRWTDDRDVDVGTMTLPTDAGTVSVTDLSFAPDLVVLTVPHAVGTEAVSGEAGQHGWTHAVALQQPDGNVQQVSTSVALDPAGSEGSGLVQDDGFHVHVHDADGDHGSVAGSVAFADDGFDLDLETVDVPDGALDGATVTYRAYALGNAATATVGRFTAPDSDGDPVDVGVDADHLLLFGNSAARSANDSRSTGDAIGLSRGVATEVDGTVSQYAVASSVDPTTGDGIAGVYDDEALHFGYGSAGSVTGATAASVDSLGTTIDLSFGSTHAGEVADASRVVSYVAIETADQVDPPAVGTLDGSRSEGDRTTVTTGFEPGAIEFVTTPGVGETGSDAIRQVGGAAHGVASGVGRQVTTSHVVRPGSNGGSVHAGETVEGRSLSIPSIDSAGAVTGTDAARVVSTSDDGFTVAFPEVADGDQVIGYRAWPADPEEVTHVVEDGLSLDDLDLAPLDALALSGSDKQAGASQLEQRMHYTLLRDPPASEPPVPDEATVELSFGEVGPDPPEDPLSVGAFLETVRELHQLVADSRPMDASDLGHPSEATDAGTSQFAGDLKDRADDAQDRLAAAGELVENRVALLETDEDEETRITEDVALLRDRLTAVHREVPIDGLATVANRIGDALAADEDALIDELDALAAHLPAGPTDRSAVDVPLVLEPRSDETFSISGAAPANTPVSVELWSTSGTEWFEESYRIETDDDGTVPGQVDLSSVTPGASFMLYVHSGSDVHLARPGRVVPPASAVTVESATDQRIEGRTDLAEGTTIDVSVTPDGESNPLVSTSVTADSNGDFVASIDATSMDPWTVFDVEATADGDTVFSSVGYVEPSPLDVVAESSVLGPLLWLADRVDAVDPHGNEGPVPDLHSAVTSEVDWETVREELELMADLHDRTGGGADAMPSESDVATVASIVDVDETSLADGQWDDGDSALESLDLEALDAAVATVGRSLSGMAVDELFDVTGRPDRAEGLQFWADRSAMTDESVLRRFHGFRTHPAGVFEEDLPDVGFAPALESVFTDVAESAFPRGETDAQRFLRYLLTFVRQAPQLVEDQTFRDELDDAHGLVRTLHAVAFHPTEVPTGTIRSTFLADLRRLTRQPVLDGTLWVPFAPSAAMARAFGIESVLAASGNERPFYNRDEDLLDLGDGETDGDGSDSTDDGQDGAGSGTPFGGTDLPDFDPTPLDAPFDLDIPDEIRTSPISGPEDTPSGTPLTDFRYLLEQFRTEVLPTYLTSLDDGSLPPDEATSRSTYATDLADRASTLESTVSTQYGHLRAGLDVGAFDVAFRRGVLETLRRGLVRVSYFGVYGSTPQSVRGGTEGDVETLLGQAGGVLSTVTERYERADRLADDTSVAAQRQRLEAIFGDDFPVLPPFRPMNGRELTATFDRSEGLQGGNPLAAETWLQRLARVRERPARFRRALTYAERLDGERHRHLTVGQLPYRESELWVGLDGEDPEPGRLSLAAQFGPGFDGHFDSGPIAGLFVDEHVENVPEATETTGVALNYDDPDVTAPHSVLLALPPEEDGWSRTALEDVVRETRRLMQFRMVDLEDLADQTEATDFGALLPMTMFPTNDASVPDAPSMPIERIATYDSLAPNPATIENFWEGSE